MTTAEKRTFEVAPRKDLTEAEYLFIPEINEHYFLAPFSDEVTYDIAENKRVILTGHMGCGKTSLYEQLAARISQPVLRANMNGQTTISDFVGFWTAKGGNTEWVDGVLPLAMRRGYWLIVDEIDFAEASILSVLNSVAEKNGRLMLKEKGHELVIPHPNFRLLATANTVGVMEDCRHLYQGANIMNRALLDRFRVYHVDYLSAAQEAKILQDSVGVPKEAADVLVKLANDIRKGFNDETLSSTFSLRQLIDLAELLNRHRTTKKGKMTPNEMITSATETCILAKVSREDGEVIKQLIQKICVTLKP